MCHKWRFPATTPHLCVISEDSLLQTPNLSYMSCVNYLQVMPVSWIYGDFIKRADTLSSFCPVCGMISHLFSWWCAQSFVHIWLKSLKLHVHLNLRETEANWSRRTHGKKMNRQLVLKISTALHEKFNVPNGSRIQTFNHVHSSVCSKFANNWW